VNQTEREIEVKVVTSVVFKQSLYRSFVWLNELSRLYYFDSREVGSGSALGSRAILDLLDKATVKQRSMNTTLFNVSQALTYVLPPFDRQFSTTLAWPNPGPPFLDSASS